MHRAGSGHSLKWLSVEAALGWGFWIPVIPITTNNTNTHNKTIETTEKLHLKRLLKFWDIEGIFRYR